MQCVRCGAVFDGRFCPKCGAPAASIPTTVAPPNAQTGWPCPRCGTLFRGNFCPRCGLPAAAWAYRAAPGPSGGRSVLSVLWTLALVGFIVFAAMDFAGLVWGPTLVVPGIQRIGSGQTVNSALDFQGNWTPNSWGTGSSLTYRSNNGNPGGYLEMTLFGPGARGFWMQSFPVDGSMPFGGVVRLDIEITGPLNSGRLLVSVDSSPISTPDPAKAIASVNYTGPVAWGSTGRLDIGNRIESSGTYYLKVAFIADAASGSVTVGFDNIRLVWATDAFVYLFVPVPFPAVIFVSQEETLFLGTYAFLMSVVVLAGLYHLIRERKLTLAAFSAPLEAVGTRLRSRSGWIAVAQTWMAVTFFQYAVVVLFLLAGGTIQSPVDVTSDNAWMWLFELLAASVREEFAFRILLIGVPMALGSVALRVIDLKRGSAPWNGPAWRHVAGAWRYLGGGAVRSDSSRETLVAAWAFLFASSAIFGLAHLPGWGWWKVAPAMVAGLGFGYLFLRHGIGAAILAHFVNDYALSLTFAGVGGAALELVLALLVLALAIAGAGFFAWYAIDAWRHLRSLVARIRPPTREVRMPTPRASYASPIIPRPAETPPEPAPPSPPAQTSLGNPSFGAAVAVRDQGRIPRDYTPSYVPPPYGYPPVRFQCPYCAWVEARYDAGRFTCTRCGRTA